MLGGCSLSNAIDKLFGSKTGIIRLPAANLEGNGDKNT